MVSITVTAWGGGQYAVRSSNPDRPRTRYAGQHDPGLAAAEALNFAAGEKAYSISGPSAVLEHIPPPLRHKM